MIIREGWLLKKGEHIKNWRARYMLLMDDGSFLGFRQKPSPGNYRDPTNNFTVRGCQIVKVDTPTHYVFTIKGLVTDQEIERNFSAGSENDRDDWCNAIIETAINLQHRESCQHQQQQNNPNHHVSPNNNNNNNHHHHQHHHHHQQAFADQDSEMIIAGSPPSSSEPLTLSNDHILTESTNNHVVHSPSTSDNSANNHYTRATDRRQASGALTNQAPPSHSNNPQPSTSRNTNDNNNPSNHHSHPHHDQRHNNDPSSHIAIGEPPIVIWTHDFETKKAQYLPQSKKMSLDNFSNIKLIGRGSWGKVMLSREKSSGSLYAIKILKKPQIILQNEVTHIITESRVMRSTNHPFLIALKYSFRDGERLCFVMEFAGGGELFYHLSQELKFSEEKSKFYGAEIVSALGYLHELGIIYRDLKLENLLLGRDGHIKIADFGLCKDNITQHGTKTFCGTPEYLSPEVIEDNYYGRAVDWWSLGVLLYEMMCGSLPFRNKSTDILFREILLKPVSFPAALSEVAKHFLNGLLNKDSAKRLGGGPDDAREIMIHPFFKDLNWDHLIAKKITPPFVPDLNSETDTRYFDTQFTQEPVNLTPIDRNHLLPSEAEASYFTHFSYAAGSQLSHQ